MQKMARVAPEILLDGKPVKKIEFHLAGEDGSFLWIRFTLENGKTQDTFYFKGTM